MELAKLQENNDILEIRLDMAVQQAAESRRKALEAEATAAAVITTPAHHLALAAAVAAAGGRSSSESSDTGEGEAGAEAAAATPASQQQRLRHKMQQELLSTGSADQSAATIAAEAAAAAASGRAEPASDGIGDLFGPTTTIAIASTPGRAGLAVPGLDLSSVAEHRDSVDIEADDLLHSMGLPSIQELPSPAGHASEGRGRTADQQQQQRAGASNSSRVEGAEAGLGSLPAKLAARRSRYWRGVPAGSSFAAAGAMSSTAVLRAAADGWPQANTDGADAAKTSAPPSRRASAAAQDLAAKLDALEGEWQGYKRTAAAAAASGSIRRSMSGGGRRSSSLPATPRLPASSGAAALSGSGADTPSGGTPSSRRDWQQAQGLQQQQQQPRPRRISLSANNSPMGAKGGVLWGGQHAETVNGEAGTAVHVDDGDSQSAEPHQHQGLLLRSISSLFKMGRGAVVAMGATLSPSRSPRDSDGVVKSLDFQDADDGMADLGTPTRGDTHSSSSSPGKAGHKGRQGRGQRHPGSPRRVGSGSSAEAATASSGDQTEDDDDDMFLLDGQGSGDGRGRYDRGRRARSRAAGDAAGEVGSEEQDDAEDGDNEDEDPSYDPALHGTPAGGRRSSKQSGRSGRHSRPARASATSSDHGEQMRLKQYNTLHAALHPRDFISRLSYGLHSC